MRRRAWQRWLGEMPGGDEDEEGAAAAEKRRVQW